MGYFEEQFGMHVQSRTRESQTAVFGNVRISVLTSRLLRVETMNADGAFCDQPTQKVWYRDFEQPRFDASQKGQMLTVRTEQAIFHYHLRKKKMESITLRGGRTVTDFESGNLRGTARTLDQSTGAVPLTKGVVSKNGVATLDDSVSLLLLEDGTITPRQKGGSDLYFFAYGHDYRGCIRDLFRLTGPAPLVPRWCLGNWWSRYKAYSQQEYMALMQRFLDEKIPITVATIDMDWHWTDVKARFGRNASRQAFHSSPRDAWFDSMSSGGWTGYSWNTELFPDYRAFLRWLKEQNFHTTLNVHPAGGVRRFEDCYEAMAKAMGIDPKSGQPVAFDITDPKFIEAYFQILHHPYEQEGVDFWWIDWQQGSQSKIKGLDPLWALNHYHYLDNRHGNKRPLILSRYAEIGSHRYPLGFSGDSKISWEVLDFQPYFTANASNAGYTWWSHDIGGHHQGEKDDELYLRWVQLGVFSPIMRLHSTNNPFMGKEPWNYRWDVSTLSKEYLRLRHRLIPYLYTMNWRTHSEGRALCEPMYYAYPENGEAYTVANEYLFGSEVIVAPITQPVDPKTNLAGVRVWLPRGRWTDVFTKRIYKGGRFVTMYRGVESIPVLAKEGAILPLSTQGETNDWKNPEQLDLLLFRGNNSFSLYEDDGETNDFEQGKYATTTFRMNDGGGDLHFTVLPAQGDIALLPAKRALHLIFADISSCSVVQILRNGQPIECEPLLENGEIRLLLNDIEPSDRLDVTLKQIVRRGNADRNQELLTLISKFQASFLWKTNTFSAFLRNPYGKIPVGAPFEGPIREILELK